MDFNDRELVNDTDVMKLVSKVCYLGEDERKRVFNIPFVRDKLRRELLKTCNEGDTYKNFRWLFNMIDIDDFFTILDYNTIHNFYKKHDGEYKLFVCLTEKNMDKTLQYIFNNDNLFKEFVSISDDVYSIFADADYEDIAKIIYKMEDMNLIAAGKGLQFLSCIGSDKQAKLLDENFKDETIVKILPYLSITNISSFFENDNRAVYLFDKFFNIVNLVNYNVKFNREILLNDKFFDKLKSDSFINFRRNINALEVNNDYLIIKKKLDKYYKELLNEYDSDSGLFKVYDEIIKNPSLMYEYRANSFIYSNDIRRIFLKHNDYDENGNACFVDLDSLKKELKGEVNRKISEVVVDALFCDNIYNVWLNIKEMLRYNSKLDAEDKVLDNDKIDFYQMILNFDKVSCEDKIDLFNKLYDKNISFSFYNDLRRLKDISYDMIKKDLIDLSKCDDKVIPDDIDGVKVYDLRDSKYTMLVRMQGIYKDKSNNRRNCYSIISDENSDTYGHGEGGIIYGYNSFDNDTVIHMLEQDAFSGDVYGGNTAVSRYVNRIMTSKELVNGSNWYSEIELVNLQNKNKEYNIKKPDFIVVYDEIRDKDIMESKRLNIPIVIIKMTRLKNENKVDTGFDNERDKYIDDSYSEKTGKKLR